MKLAIENPNTINAIDAKKVAIMLCRRGYINIEPPAAEPAKKNNPESIPEALRRKHGRRA